MADDEKKLEGRYNSSLTDIGISQAQETLCEFRELGYLFDAILTSPLSRALKTAEIINIGYGVPLISDDILMERDNGVLAGLVRAEADLKYPINHKITPLTKYPNQSGENLVVLHSRALAALDFILQRRPGQYLVVSHGNFLNALVRVILGVPIPLNNSGCFFSFRDNGFIEFEYHENDHKWIMRRLI
ncbi:MAG: histidine phosphatase family protein [Fibrobacteres bacterium]|nr:histidine phosphatase family protein [Fibrobacterota bacterium]